MIKRIVERMTPLMTHDVRDAWFKAGHGSLGLTVEHGIRAKLL